MLQVQLQAIFLVTFRNAQEAQESRSAIEEVSVEDTNTAITAALVAMGFAGTIEVTGKEAKIQDQGRPNAATVQNFTLAVLLGLAIPYFLSAHTEASFAPVTSGAVGASLSSGLELSKVSPISEAGTLDSP